METTAPKSTLFGYAAEFETPEALITAARLAREAGYTQMDAYSPMPVEGLSEAIGFRNKQMPFMMLMGGIAGGTIAMVGQWYANSWSYPLNIGGRPYFSWPMFIVPTFEMTILFAALTGVFGMIILNGLPQPYHSIFNTPGFDRASSDRFFLAIESRDPKFDGESTRQFMEGLSAVRVSAVAK